jgi:hypothetical protein
MNIIPLFPEKEEKSFYFEINPYCARLLAQITGIVTREKKVKVLFDGYPEYPIGINATGEVSDKIASMVYSYSDEYEQEFKEFYTSFFKKRGLLYNQTFPLRVIT